MNSHRETEKTSSQMMLEARTAAVSARSLSSRLSETVSILLRRAGSGRTANISARWQIANGASLFSPPPCLSALLERSKNVSHRSLFEPWTQSSPARRLLPISLVRHPRERAGARERAGEAREKPSYLKKIREMAACPLLSSSQAPALLGRSGNSNVVSYRLVRSE